MFIITDLRVGQERAEAHQKRAEALQKRAEVVQKRVKALQKTANLEEVNQVPEEEEIPVMKMTKMKFAE